MRYQECKQKDALELQLQKICDQDQRPSLRKDGSFILEARGSVSSQQAEGSVPTLYRLLSGCRLRCVLGTS